MKVWKQILLSGCLLAGIGTSVFYSACVQNVCNNVNCFNGGSCRNGLCNCPTGYEGPQCQTLSISRYLGTYVGSTACNEGSATLDTVWIGGDDNYGINGVDVKMKSLLGPPEYKGLLYGIVNSNLSVYTIQVVNEDSSASLIRDYTITLVNDKTLTISEYIRDYRDTLDTISQTCTFTGSKLP